MNYMRFLNRISRNRKRSPLRLLNEIIHGSPPSLISMANGMPNADQFPFHDAIFTLRDGSSVEIDATEMRKALQYNPTSGFEPLRKWLIDFQRKEHSPPNMDSKDEEKTSDLLITTGSQQALSMALEMMINPGDKVLLGSQLYPGVKAILEPYEADFLLVDTDGDGIKPESLRKTLSQWTSADVKQEGSNIPKMLYTVPNGDNPTGATIAVERRKQIYEICHEYDIIILEDDPYYFLQFTKPRLPSFMSMDVDGRVLRFDSFSKVLSSGIRVGFVTGPRALTYRIQLHMEASLLHSSTLSHVVIYKLFQNWGEKGFLEHVDKVADFYQQQRDKMLRAADKYLSGIATWTVPSGGMFLWIELNVPDTFDVIMRKALEKEVLFVPGAFCSPQSSGPSKFVRASFSVCTEEQMNEGMRRLSELIKDEMRNSGSAI